MPARLALCDLGAPGWGEPWFPHSAVLLYSHMGMAIFVMFVFSVLFFAFTAIPIPAMIQGYHAFSFRGHITGLPATFPLLGLVCVVCFCLCCLCVFLFGFVLFFGFCFVTEL